MDLTASRMTRKSVVEAGLEGKGLISLGRGRLCSSDVRQRGVSSCQAAAEALVHGGEQEQTREWGCQTAAGTLEVAGGLWKTHRQLVLAVEMNEDPWKVFG